MFRTVCLISMILLFAPDCQAANSVKREVAKGNDLFTQQLYDQAAKKYEQALVDEPDSDVVNYNLGGALYKLENYEDAIGQLERSLVTDQPSIEQKASYNIGNAEYKYGISFEENDIDKAIDLLRQSLRHYERAIEIDKEDQDAVYNYEFVKKELERLLKKKEEQKDQQQDQNQQQQNQDQQQQQQQQQNQDQQQQQQRQQDQEQQESEKEQQENDEQQQQDEEEQRDEQQQEQSDKQQQQQENERQSAGASSAELSQKEAESLLEDYSREEEPKGLYKEKMETRGLPEVLKDW